MKQKKQKEVKKKRTKKQLALQITTIVLIVVAGLASGFYCANLYLASKHKKVDYSKFKEEDLVADVAAVLEKNKGKSISEVAAVDAYVIAENNLKSPQLCPQYVAIANASLRHNYGKQTIYTYAHRYNGIDLKEEISYSSMKSVCKKIVRSSDSFKIYGGNVTSPTEAAWDDNFANMSETEYKNTFGLNANDVLPYIVSEKTIDSTDKDALKANGGQRLANGNYQFSIKLNTATSVLKYVKKIRYMSGLSDFPTFSQMDITFVVDKDFRFVSITTTETYSFKYVGGIFVTCSGSITTNYDYKTTPTEI